MPVPSETIDWESDLAHLLDELSSVQQELLDLLEAKRARMADHDLKGMTQLQPREQQLCDRLQTCHQRRATLLGQAAAHGLPGESLGRLASSLNPDKRREMTRQVKDAASRMRLLQHQSLANWVLAQRTMLHLSQLLEIIATGGRLQPTYGRGEPRESCGALVDREA